MKCESLIEWRQLCVHKYILAVLVIIIPGTRIMPATRQLQELQDQALLESRDGEDYKLSKSL